MAQSLGDIVQEIVEREKRKLAAYDVKHPGIIGDLYEGLARQVAERMVLPAGNFHVVEGLIRNSKGDLSRQIDCMVVEGEGEVLGNTRHHVYPIERVVAVFEIKKSLYGADLLDAMALMADLWTRIAEPKAVREALLRDAWRGIHGTELPERDQLKTLSEPEQLLFHSLVMEAILPVRVVLGFEGYANVGTLRAGFVKVMRDELNAGRPVPGPVACPSVVVAKEATLIKLNGMPYPGPWEDGRWLYLGSRRERPFDVLVELLWTRFTYYFGASNAVFGEDLALEAVDALVWGRPRAAGWDVDIVDLHDAEPRKDLEWSPAQVSRAAFEVVQRLCREELVTCAAPNDRLWAAAQGTSMDAITDELIAARVAYRAGDVVKLLTKECHARFVPGIGFMVGENSSGRFDRWLRKRGL